MYNGNIRHIVAHNKKLGTPLGNAYRYDQLHRFKQMRVYNNYDLPNWQWLSGSSLSAYETTTSYDANGNISNMTRKADTGATMDQLTYNYVSGKNRLNNVGDAINKNAFPDDFDTQTTIGAYVYDKAGNIKSSPADTALIGWTPYGKVDTVSRSHLNQKIKFGYDAMQNRVMKAFIKTNTSDTTFTYYIRDAQGNVMAVYERQKDTVIWREQYLYGSSRLGNFEPGVSWRPGAMPLDVPYFRADSAWYLGAKNYELTDHLGNVTAALSDRKQAFDTNADKQADYYEPVVLSATDYYPFGFEMPGRKFNIGDYRYGFNGKEADRKGEWASVVHYDYGFRVYNPALGRFESVDPLMREYPWYSPYQFAGNSPILNVDLDGLEEANANQIRAAKTTYTEIKLVQSEYFKNISPSLINSQVNQRLNSLGKKINQGKFFLCGPAAACHIAASHDPESYVRTVFELYKNGVANNGKIKANEAIYDAKPSGGKIDGIDAVDWILLHSLRRSENAINWAGGYDPHSLDDVKKMTLKDEFDDLVYRLGANVSFAKSNASISTQADIKNISTWINEGKKAVLFINSRAYRGQDSGAGFDGWVSRNYGRHFIVLKEFSQGKDGSINIKYWDYGNSSLKAKTFESLEKFKESTFNYWLIKNKGQ